MIRYLALKNFRVLVTWYIVILGELKETELNGSYFPPGGNKHVDASSVTAIITQILQKS